MIQSVEHVYFEKNLYNSDFSCIVKPKNLGDQDEIEIKKKVITPLNEETGLPKELSHIQKAIEDSRFILDLEFDWDDEGGSPINAESYNRAIRFLERYSMRAFNVFNFIFEEPHIQAVGDGSVDLEWHTNKAMLLINFPNKNEGIAVFYGKVKESNYENNGKIKTDVVDDSFVSWLKNLS